MSRDGERGERSRTLGGRGSESPDGHLLVAAGRGHDERLPARARCRSCDRYPDHERVALASHAQVIGHDHLPFSLLGPSSRRRLGTRARVGVTHLLEDRTEIDARVAPGMRVAVGERRGCGAVRCGLRHAFAASLATVLIETPSSAAMSLCVLSRPMRSRIRHSRSVKG